jgi:aspartyl-tRNA(Asn)/glutamyl-tRNA(Gln) amidotransferase subunit B
LPRNMAARFQVEYGLGEYDATQLTQSLALANYFETTAKACGQAKLASNWITGEMAKRLNAQSLTIAQAPLSPDTLAAIIDRISDGTISNNGARQVFELLWLAGGLGEGALSPAYVDRAIEDHGLKQMNDTGALDAIVQQVIDKNEKNVAEFKAGNEKALNALVGQIMKASAGKANPQQVNELLRSKLA